MRVAVSAMSVALNARDVEGNKHESERNRKHSLQASTCYYKKKATEQRMESTNHIRTLSDAAPPATAPPSVSASVERLVPPRRRSTR
jgi:hypothetical protein